ncbi:PPOX class F420-dependent oxidoreductase [Ktedonobacter sp. SOSP1-52]|uniref:PPOX class F420-dependent oxidoreductase n=1 Tax=Ktedonobacter sp. SOSP1-52 TaxID=2778366 RepID=UPI0019168702|nr:PPOX class F420-dependent oxidoreductase [Ktedonobacter sp. SOSP1-52]GHO62633.1 PPOX class F420-dependent oxidoreductase [Ktedonobacter sp. SOSP1-52]
MSHFTETEIAYMQEQKLGRLATVDTRGNPHVVPVGFRYNSELDTIDVGGYNMGKSKKFRDAGRHGRAAFVIDDVLPPGQPRGVEIRGRSEAIQQGGREILQNENVDAEFIRITPTHIISWGIDTHPYRPNSRKVSS